MPLLPRRNKDEDEGAEASRETGDDSKREIVGQHGSSDHDAVAHDDRQATDGSDHDDRLDTHGAHDDRDVSDRDRDDDGRDDRDEETSETGRVTAVKERPQQGDDDEYQWHTGLNRPTGAPDAVEFIDIHKAFGSNKILRGLNMGPVSYTHLTLPTKRIV